MRGRYLEIFFFFLSPFPYSPPHLKHIPCRRQTAVFCRTQIKTSAGVCGSQKVHACIQAGEKSRGYVVGLGMCSCDSFTLCTGRTCRANLCICLTETYTNGAAGSDVVRLVRPMQWPFKKKKWWCWTVATARFLTDLKWWVQVVLLALNVIALSWTEMWGCCSSECLVLALALLSKAKESTSDVRGGCGQHVLPFSVCVRGKLSFYVLMLACRERPRSLSCFCPFACFLFFYSFI